MARVFRHSYTKKMPDGRREKRTCAKWYIEYTEPGGRVRRVPGFTDKRATEARANELQRRVDREEAGIIDRASVELSQQLSSAIGQHMEAYRVHLQASSVSAWHLSETTRRLKRMIADCRFDRLSEIKAEPVQRWCNRQITEQRPDGDESKGMGPRTVNTYVGSLRAFVRWCIADGRMAVDPLATVTKLDESADVRRVRRALTEDELTRLLDMAERRPVLDAMTIRRGQRKGEVVAKLRDATRARLERLGRERRLIYMTLVLTGLRRGELDAIRWGDLQLDDPQVWVTIPASVAKNRKADALPIRADLAAELRAWRDGAGKLSDSDRVFNVPTGLVHILKRDLKAAGIDPEGVDVHSMRHTTATYLAKAGVAPRTAQSIMRHSDIRLTLGTYTDPKLLDMAGALTALPKLIRSPGPQPIRVRATGTHGKAGPALGVSLGGKMRSGGHRGATMCSHTDSDGSVAPKAQPVSGARVSNDLHVDSQQRANGLEPSTFSLEG